MKPLYVSEPFTALNGFTSGIEGPACDAAGNLYAVNYERQGTIGIVTPEGQCDVFVELPNGSIGNGIRFTRAGQMLIADYTNHNVLRVDMQTRAITVHAHEPGMNQPNDIAITDDDVVFASDPNWSNDTGQLWRIDTDGTVTLLEDGMGTTNGIEVSPCGRILYVNESVQRRIWAYDLAADGTISGKRLFTQFEDYGLDGMRCDAQGNLFVTRHGKGVVAMLSAAGELLREIALAGKLCTNVAFGGEDGCTVYVTVADLGYVERFRTEAPGRCRSLFIGQS